MKKFLILALLAVLISPSIAAIVDPYDMLRGKQMIRDQGAPWLDDDAVLYFGEDKDGSLKFNSTSGYLEMVGLTAYDNTSFTLESGEDLTFAGGDSLFNAGSASGAFTTSTGTNTLSGNTVISGSKTFTTGTGAVSLAGDTTVSSNKVLAVTTADKLTVGGVIVPQEMVVTIPLSSVAAGRNNSACFIASDAWQITHIEEAHPVAESSAATMTVDVIKMTGTQALTGGVNLTEAAFNLKGTANTVQAGAVSTNSGVATLADGNRIGVVINMTAVSNPAQFLNGGISIHMKRV